MKRKEIYLKDTQHILNKIIVCFLVKICGQFEIYKREVTTETKFKELKSRLKFKTGLKYGYFHLKLYLICQDLSRR